MLLKHHHLVFIQIANMCSNFKMNSSLNSYVNTITLYYRCHNIYLCDG